MSKRTKIWLWAMTFLMLLDIVMHFIACDTPFASHINYIASVLLAFTLGLCIADTPKWKGISNGERN